MGIYLRTPVKGETGKLLHCCDCPVIKPDTRVEVLDVLEFPATGSIFITIKDLENVNYNHKGQPEPIISTIRWV